MLQGDLDAVDLALIGESAKLPVKLGALGKAGRSERMALRDQSARGIDDPFPPVCDIARLDQLATFALAAEPQALVGDELVCREAVVQFDDVDVLGSKPRGGKDLLGGLAGHIGADQLDGAIAKG